MTLKRYYATTWLPLDALAMTYAVRDRLKFRPIVVFSKAASARDEAARLNTEHGEFRDWQ